MEMQRENNKATYWNVYEFCYVKLIVFLNKNCSISQCINILLHFSEKIKRLNASKRFWLLASALLQHVVSIALLKTLLLQTH